MERIEKTTQQEKSEQLFQAILTPHPPQETLSQNKENKKTTVLSIVLSPLKFLWKFYMGLAKALGFVFLTLITISFLLAPVSYHQHTNYNSALPTNHTGNPKLHNVPILRAQPQPTQHLLSSTEATVEIQKIIAQQKSPSVLETLEKVNSLFQVSKQHSGSAFELKFVNKNQLVFSVSHIEPTQNAKSFTYDIDFKDKEVILTRSSDTSSKNAKEPELNILRYIKSSDWDKYQKGQSFDWYGKQTTVSTSLSTAGTEAMVIHTQL